MSEPARKEIPRTISEKQQKLVLSRGDRKLQRLVLEIEANIVRLRRQVARAHERVHAGAQSAEGEGVRVQGGRGQLSPEDSYVFLLGAHQALKELLDG